MIAVTIVALALGLRAAQLVAQARGHRRRALVEQRRSRFLRLAIEHRLQIAGWRNDPLDTDERGHMAWFDREGRRLTPQQVARDAWHYRLAKKYFAASEDPELPVPPDPPEPE